MKKIIGVSALLIVCFLMGLSLHKFYLSVLNIDFDQKEKSLKMTLKTFADDMQQALEKKFHISTEIPAEGVLPPRLREKMGKYLLENIKLKMNGQEVLIRYLGSESDWDDIYHYLEVENIQLDAVHQITLRNTVLMEIFSKQKNITHFNLGGIKQTLVMVGDQHEKSFKCN